MKVRKWLVGALGGLLLCGWGGLAAAASVTIDDIRFAALPDNQFEVRLHFSATPPAPQSYALDSPARLVFDFDGVESALAEKKYSLAFENARSAVILGTKSRTRLVLNLERAVGYRTRLDGDAVVILVGAGESAERASAGARRASDRFPPAPLAAASGGIANIDFQRGADGAGVVAIGLADAASPVDVSRVGDRITLVFAVASLPEHLNRKLDVVDFATPVQSIDSQPQGNGTRVVITATGEYDYLAYQVDRRYVVSVKPLSKRELAERKADFAYTGKKLSLNFQDIEVRSVLQVIADFTELNLVASDTVTGNITLRLQNVPWDQALDIVLKAKGLDQRQVGNVIMVAPATEIAKQEELQVKANKQLAELAPLVTEYVRIRYADAPKLLALFDNPAAGRGGAAYSGADTRDATASLLSPRGSAVVDERTNTIIVTDVSSRIEAFKNLVQELDIPIRQVEIEARIVVANTDFREEMGVRWGAQGVRGSDGRRIGFGGSLENFASPNNPIEIFGPTGGTILVNDSALAVDLGVANPAGRFAFELLTNNTFLDLELSVLESSGRGEIISQPKVLTGDKQKATIKSGVQIPYNSGTSAGNTQTEFKDAVLQLDVTPQITPDNRIIMDLKINQDAVGKFVPSGDGGGLIPSIDVTELITQALVGNGQTLVLGGVFKMETSKGQEKVPLLGDIPVLGRLFRHDIDTRVKQEILIFITPRIIDDALLDR